MRNISLLAAIGASVIALGAVSCETDRHAGEGTVSEAAIRSLDEMYPGATDIEWKVKGEYAVADFRYTSAGEDKTAWFLNVDGSWGMTETDITYEQLPQAVRESFEAGEYASWRIDDIDLLERIGVEDIYVIEVEGISETGETEAALYYSADGTLVKKVIGADDGYDYGDYIPDRPESGIEDFIKTKYPGARIIDIDTEDEGIEVEIIDNGILRELLFSYSGEWIFTKTEIRLSEVPEHIIAALNASEYASYRVDDVDHFLSAAKGEYYRFELESRDSDMVIEITSDGEIREATGEGQGSGVPSSGIDEFIQSRYPGARIIEKDFDDGYIEVSIIHENIEKEVYFNGAEEWVRSEWDIRYSELPETVRAVLENNYQDYKIDDITFVESPQGEWYKVELEEKHGEKEITVRINGAGDILK